MEKLWPEVKALLLLKKGNNDNNNNHNITVAPKRIFKSF